MKSALADGYKNAFSAIFDSNLTSVITAIILLVYGTGLIKGFATTLLISLICSFFTAVFISRLAFEWMLKKKRFEKLTFTTKISDNFLRDPKINFLGHTKITNTIIAAVCVVILVSFFTRGLNRGIDFSGGRNYIVQFDHDVNTADIQEELAPLFPESSLSVITIDNDSKVRISTNYKIADQGENIDEEVMQILYKGLQSELNGMKYEDFNVSNESVGVVQTEKVGPSIADDMTQGAVWALYPVAFPRLVVLDGCFGVIGVHFVRDDRFLFVVLGRASVLYGNRPVVHRGYPYDYRLCHQRYGGCVRPCPRDDSPLS